MVATGRPVKLAMAFSRVRMRSLEASVPMPTPEETPAVRLGLDLTWCRDSQPQQHVFRAFCIG